MKKEKNIQASTPGFELAPCRLVGKHSLHCATYALGNLDLKLSYIIKYSRLKSPKMPFFQVQWLTATLIHIWSTILHFQHS